jgi:ribosomal protein S27E
MATTADDAWSKLKCEVCGSVSWQAGPCKPDTSFPSDPRPECVQVFTLYRCVGCGNLKIRRAT